MYECMYVLNMHSYTRSYINIYILTYIYAYFYIIHKLAHVFLVSDTYVKVQLLSFNGQEISRTKTSVRRGQPNPVFKESFMFQVASFQLGDVTLMVSVFNKKNMKKKDMMGWCSLGKLAYV